MVRTCNGPASGISSSRRLRWSRYQAGTITGVAGAIVIALNLGFPNLGDRCPHDAPPRPMLRGTARLRFKFTLTMAAYDLIRLPKLLGAAA